MKKIVTHTTSRFHSDDVFAVATLDLFFKGDIEIVRTHDPEIIQTGDIVVDIGKEYDFEKGRFDHHQRGGAGERGNGIQYASFGLVWKHYGRELAGSDEASDLIDKRLVQPVDANDNGQMIFDLRGEVSPYTVQDIMYLFRENGDDESKDLLAFKEAVKLAKFILEKEIENAQRYVEAKKETLENYSVAEDKRVIIFDNENFSSDTRAAVLSEFSEPLFVIYPDKGRGSWRAKGVRVGEGFEIRKSLPEEWGGKYDDDLQSISGVSDATFCHRGLFTCAAKTKEGVLKMVDLAMNKS